MFMISNIFRRYLTTSRMVSQQTTQKVQQLIKDKPVFIASKVSIFITPSQLPQLAI